MYIENFLWLGIDSLLENGNPGFHIMVLEDINRLGGTRKKRIIEVPNEEMKMVHRRFISYLRSLPVKYLYASGCLPGNSPLKNVERHSNNRFGYLLDLKNAYYQVNIEKLAKIICQADSRLTNQEETIQKIKGFLEKYFMSRYGGLTIGGPASPDLFNVYCHYLLDIPLGEISEKYEWTYSRYLDDLAFSSQIPLTRSQREEIRSVIEKNDFVINHLKSRVYDLKKGSVIINGLRLESGGRIIIPRSFLTSLEGIMHKVSQSSSLQNDQKLIRNIQGRMGVFKGVVNPKKMNQREKRLVLEYRKFQKACRKRGV